MIKDGMELVYWEREEGALTKDGVYLLRKAVSFLTRLTTLCMRDKKVDETYIDKFSVCNGNIIWSQQLSSQVPSKRSTNSCMMSGHSDFAI